MISKVVVLAVFLIGMNALGANPVLEIYKKQSMGKDQASREKGETFYGAMRVNSKGEKVGCTTCHTTNPKAIGRTRANKDIKPLAPIANTDRFTDFANVEKWFKRNCNDVYERECTVSEKINFIEFMLSIK